MEKVEELIINTLNDIVDISRIKDDVSDKSKLINKLVFPKKRNGNKRIREQEVNFFFSVEAHIMKKYQFTGKSERSGNIDLCFYKDGSIKGNQRLGLD